ncbi:hypothetical protein PC119_g14215 [Phytophthora cactorum]|uniref:Uncharacterized protein n=1 Tax=Phytophthora cactorum TaxID=29920 RepID=A0A8T1CWJ3_9STRA|nr:hypothetical protein PC114_g14247 [Phytophthora cactorum]KAG2929135.1 hypothetical protein PC117_g14076 [Phytophthora cactorum]KAG3008521.1 hypothetical protein PC119_g14215 [Phytophthora cactorum]
METNDGPSCRDVLHHSFWSMLLNQKRTETQPALLRGSRMFAGADASHISVGSLNTPNRPSSDRRYRLVASVASSAPAGIQEPGARVARHLGLG